MKGIVRFGKMQTEAENTVNFIRAKNVPSESCKNQYNTIQYNTIQYNTYVIKSNAICTQQQSKSNAYNIYEVLIKRI